MSRFLRTRRDDRGVVALELVLAMPILVMLIVGAVVLGIYLSLQTRALSEVRDGARDAALGKTPRYGTVIAGECNAPVLPGDTVTVRVTKDVTLPDLIPISLLDDPIEETLTMRCGT